MAFHGLMNKIVLVYLDDIIVFSKNANEHFEHLRQIFQRCREFKVSLKPEKYIFMSTKASFYQDMFFLSMEFLLTLSEFQPS